MNKRLFVIDDFLKNPKKLLKFAREKKWKKNGRSTELLLPRPQARRICDQFSKTCDLKFDISSTNYTGSLRKTRSPDLNSIYKFRAHFDGGWNALVYLNENHHSVGGTAFYIHKKSGLDGFTNLKSIHLALKKNRWKINDLVECILSDEKKPEEWIEIMRVSSKFNRATVFDGFLFHSHVSDRGFGVKKPRLTLNYYFNNPTLDLEWFKASRLIYSTSFFRR